MNFIPTPSPSQTTTTTVVIENYVPDGNHADRNRILEVKKNLEILLTPASSDIDSKCDSYDVKEDIVIKEDAEDNKSTTAKKYYKFFIKITKISFLVLIWIVSGYVLMKKNVKVDHVHQISIPHGVTKGYAINELPKGEKLFIQLEGALLPPYYSNLSTNCMYIWIQYLVTVEPIINSSELVESNIILLQNISETWKVPLVSENLIGVVPEVKEKRLFKLANITLDDYSNNVIRINILTNLKSNLPLVLSYDLDPINVENGVIYAAIILVGLYVLIIFEIVHHTLAALLACTMSIAVLAVLNAKPTMAEIVSWIDIETLLLLFSMMIIVTIFSETGIFDYMAVLAYRFTNGREWPLINALCLFTAALSCFLDTVTTVLLMTPTTIRLCEVMQMDPIPVLICMIIYSNIGGAITPIGDPPNVIISSNADFIKSGATFISFTVHMGIGVLIASLFVHIHLKFYYRNKSDFHYKDPEERLELMRTIAVWKRATASVGSYSKDEECVKKSMKERTDVLLVKLQKKTTSNITSPSKAYANNLKELQLKYPIKDIPLLVKSSCVLLFVIVLFFLHSIPEMSRLSLGWTSLLGALLLLLLTDREDLESVFIKVEWATLLFFASLFILMEALARLGLIEWIGKQTQTVIMSVEQESRLAVAIVLIIWVSAGVSAFVDNIPLTSMMIRVVTVLASDAELQLPLQPLVWALSFGACFGGNGTLFGSSSNIICAGVAEQHGYKLTFVQFMKIGFPVMITSVLSATLYLMIAHVAFQWH